MKIKNIKIVIVDTGLYEENKLLINYKTKNIGFSITFDNSNIKINKNFNDIYGHGTAVNYIIRKHEENIEIINIKIFETDNGVDEESLIKTLQYIYNNIECNIINLSLGLSVCQKYKELYNICEDLKNKGIVLISAFNNDGSMSYPASFNNVLVLEQVLNVKIKMNFIIVIILM